MYEANARVLPAGGSEGPPDTPRAPACIRSGWNKKCRGARPNPGKDTIPNVIGGPRPLYIIVPQLANRGVYVGREYRPGARSREQPKGDYMRWVAVEVTYLE